MDGFYPDAEERLPNLNPDPLVRQVIIRAYVDFNYYGNLLNRRSHSGIIMYVNNASILWYSKKQNTVEVLSFESKFVAICITAGMIENLRYELRCFVVDLFQPKTGCSLSFSGMY